MHMSPAANAAKAVEAPTASQYHFLRRWRWATGQHPSAREAFLQNELHNG